jgi:hypothetical protein
MTNTRQIKISIKHKELLQNLMATSETKFEKEFVEKMIDYFHETGLDPKDKIKSVPGELSKLRNTLVSFIKEQEKTKLNPILNKLDDITDFTVKFSKEEAVTKQDLADFLEIAFGGQAGSDQVKITKQNAKQIFNKLISGLKEDKEGLIINRELFLEVKNQMNAL